MFLKAHCKQTEDWHHSELSNIIHLKTLSYQNIQPPNYKLAHEEHTLQLSYHHVTAASVKWKQAFHQCFVLTQILQFKGILSHASIQGVAELLDYFINCF